MDVNLRYQSELCIFWVGWKWEGECVHFVEAIYFQTSNVHIPYFEMVFFAFLLLSQTSVIGSLWDDFQWSPTSAVYTLVLFLCTYWHDWSVWTQQKLWKGTSSETRVEMTGFHYSRLGSFSLIIIPFEKSTWWHTDIRPRASE